MDCLPLELYEMILNYVDIADLFNLRLLNKKFNYIVSQYRIQELTVFNPEAIPRKRRFGRVTSGRDFVYYKSIWFSSNLPKNFLHLVDKSKLFLLKNPAESPLFSLAFLKRLKVDHFDGNRAFRLKDVNRFAGLEELEIMIDEQSDEDKLTLPKLRILQISLRGSFRFHFSVSIEAVKLEAVCFDRSDYNFTSPGHFQFRFPLTVSYLKTGCYHKSILAFSNLQHLEINRNSFVDANILSHFVGLKELTILGCRRDVLDSIVRSSNGPGLKINYEAPRQTSWISRDERDELAFYSDYSEISYYNLVRSLSEIPSDFFARLNAIQVVNVYDKVQDPDHLLEFLGNCPILSDLLIQSKTLKQSFFDKLPVVCSLNRLVIANNAELRLDYTFILRMFYLSCFKTNEELSTDVICKLGVPFYLESVEFQFNEMLMSLKRSKGERYLVVNYLEIGLSDRGKTVKPERLAKLLSSLKSKSTGSDGRKRQRIS